MKEYLLILVIGFVLQLILTPIFKKVALYFKFVDNPEFRKLHKTATPLLGGAGIVLTFIILLAVFYEAATDLNLKGVLFGGVMIALVGLFDDKYGVRWLYKLLFQIAIVSIVIFGFDIKTTILDNYWLDSFLTIFWVVGLTNSINLMDNMDGLSAGTAAIAAFFFSLLALKEGQLDLSIYSFALFVSCLSFLNFNFPPAQIFMGDMGSMFLGLNLGFIAVLLQVTSFQNWELANTIPFREYSVFTALIPLLVLAVPLFDTLLVMILRPLNGVKISTPGRDHSSHRLTLLKGPFQKFVDKSIIRYLKFSKRNLKMKKENLSPGKAISQTRSVVVIYFIEVFMGVIALTVTELSIFESGIMLVFIIAMFYQVAKRLATMKVY